MKNFIFFQAQAASCLKEIIQFPHQIQASYVSETKIFFRRFKGVYKHFFSNCFKNAVLGRLEIVHCKCFSDTIRKKVSWKICKVSKVFCCVAGVNSL